MKFVTKIKKGDRYWDLYTKYGQLGAQWARVRLRIPHWPPADQLVAVPQGAPMNVREFLEEHPKYDFYLVGSQALGTAKPDSDWDYVVSVEEGVLGELLGRGFANVMGADVRVDDAVVYGDNGKYVKAIVQRRCDETGVLVQVAIVADASLKLRIMDVLKSNRILRDFDLSLHRTKERNYLWDALYQLVGWQGEPGGTGGAQYAHKQEPKKKETFVDFPVDEDIPF